jgi:pyruvate dehydrogenase (quinone)
MMMGLSGHSVSKAGELKDSVQSWLSQPGPALRQVKVKPLQLVMPPLPLVSPETVVGMRLQCQRNAARQGHDVREMMVEISLTAWT